MSGSLGGSGRAETPRHVSRRQWSSIRSEVRITRYNSVSSTERVTGGPSPLRRGGRAVNLRYWSYNSVAVDASDAVGSPRRPKARAESIENHCEEEAPRGLRTRA